MNKKTDNPWQTIDKQIIYDSPWIIVHHHDVITPTGTKGIYGYVEFKHIAVGIIPIDKDGNTWLVGQYRYPNKEFTWEIPEGGAKKTELPVEGAKRELLEECGISAKNWEMICEMRLSNSASDEIAYLFVATDLDFTAATPDETEDLIVKKVTFQKAYEMVMSGEITDSMSIAGILKYAHLLKNQELL